MKVSLAPVESGFAAIGLADKFNCGAALSARHWADKGCTLHLRDGGRFLAWAERVPLAVLCNGVAVAFDHDLSSWRLCAQLPATGPCPVSLKWPGALPGCGRVSATPRAPPGAGWRPVGPAARPVHHL